MSNWDSIFDDAKSAAKKAVKKGSTLSEAAALKIKIMSKRKDISEEYKRLGAFVYKKLKTTSPEAQDEVTAKIGGCVNKIDTYMIELARLNHEYDATMNEGRRDEKKYTVTPEEVMAGFNEARAEADEDYAEAISLAEEAKEIAKEMK